MSELPLKGTRQRLYGKRKFVVGDTTLKDYQYELGICQEPELGRVFIQGEKMIERAIQPTPIIKLLILTSDESKKRIILQSPNIFLQARLITANESNESNESTSSTSSSSSTSTSTTTTSSSPSQSQSQSSHQIDTSQNFGFLAHSDKEIKKEIAGCSVSSLHYIRHFQGNEAGIFAFPNICVKSEGSYKLCFDLYEIRGTQVFFCKTIISNTFQIYSAETFPGFPAITDLSRRLVVQGVKIPQKGKPWEMVKRETSGNSSNLDEPMSYSMPRSSTHDSRAEQRQKQGNRLKFDHNLRSTRKRKKKIEDEDQFGNESEGEEEINNGESSLESEHETDSDNQSETELTNGSDGSESKIVNSNNNNIASPSKKLHKEMNQGKNNQTSSSSFIKWKPFSKRTRNTNPYIANNLKPNLDFKPSPQQNQQLSTTPPKLTYSQGEKGVTQLPSIQQILQETLTTSIQTPFQHTNRPFVPNQNYHSPNSLHPFPYAQEPCRNLQPLQAQSILIRPTFFQHKDIQKHHPSNHSDSFQIDRNTQFSSPTSQLTSQSTQNFFPTNSQPSSFYPFPQTSINLQSPLNSNPNSNSISPPANGIPFRPKAFRVTPPF